MATKGLREQGWKPHLYTLYVSRPEQHCTASELLQKLTWSACAMWVAGTQNNIIMQAHGIVTIIIQMILQFCMDVK